MAGRKTSAAAPVETPASENDSLVQFNARIPASLKRRIKVTCAQKDMKQEAFVSKALSDACDALK